MSPLLRSHSRGLLEFRESVTAEEIDEIATDPIVSRLQTGSPVEVHTWDVLNQDLFSRRPDIQLRVYGFYGSICDLSFLKRLPNLQRFAADSLMTAVGVENLAALEKLEELSIGIYDLESFDFLNRLPSGIAALYLSATKSKKPNLKPLGRFHSLRKLYLEGQQNQIGILEHLEQMEDLTLRSISTSGLAYLAKLPRLWSLDIKLGGITDLSALCGKESLKYLELWQVRGLSDISVISSLIGLQYLFLQSLPNISSVPDLSRLTRLRRVHLEKMKGLQDMKSICSAPALEQFVHVFAENIQPSQYDELLQMPSLQEVNIGFGNVKKNQSFKEAIARSGKRTFSGAEFVFRQ